MAYCTQEDIVARIGMSELVGLADDDGDGLPDSSKVVQAIADADAVIDSFLSNRYSTPLSAPPAVVKALSITIAIYNLAKNPPRRPTEGQKEDYESALKALQRVHDRKQDLPGISEKTGVDDKVNVGVTDGQERVFDRGTLEDF